MFQKYPTIAKTWQGEDKYLDSWDHWNLTFSATSIRSLTNFQIEHFFFFAEKYSRYDNHNRSGELLKRNGYKHFPKRNWNKRRLCWLSADLSLVLSITEFWNLTRLSQPTCIASNRMKCRLSYAKYVRHLLIDEVQFCFMKILGRMLALQKLPYLEYEILSHIPISSAHWLRLLQSYWQ